MFSIRQKREIADAVQKILRDTNHHGLPKGEIRFNLHVYGAEVWSWADIQNNGVVIGPVANPWNEKQDQSALKNSKGNPIDARDYCGNCGGWQGGGAECCMHADDYPNITEAEVKQLKYIMAAVPVIEH